MNKKTIKFIVAGVVLLLALLITVTGVIGNNDAGFYQVKQSFPSGEMSVISKPGLFAQMFGKTTEYKVSDTYYFSTDDLDGGDGADAVAIPVRFSGGGTADISGSVKYKIPVGDEARLILHEDFRNDDAIRQDLIRQYVQEVLKNTATLYKPEDTYSGGRGEFVATFQAQLEEGIYRTESTQVKTKDADGNELTETIVNIIRDENGNPIIDKVSPFITYNISLMQVSIKDIDYSESVDKLIVAKQTSEQEKVLARAASEKAKQDAITAVEEGKAEVAKAEAAALVAKKTAIVKAEQAKEVAELKAQEDRNVATTKAEQERDVALLAEERATAEANALLVKKEADAKANALLVKAGLTPLQKAEIEKETAIGVARELAKVNVPSILITGGEEGGADPMNAIGIKMLQDIMKSMGQN